MRAGGRLSVLGFCLVVCSALSTVIAGTAIAGAQGAATPPLTTTVVFGRSSYVSGQTVTATLRVHNPGRKTVKVDAIADTGPGKLGLGRHGFGKFDGLVAIPAGRTVSAKVSGNPYDLDKKTVTLSGYLFGAGGDEAGSFSGAAPVHLRTTTVHGEVFGDVNASGHPDPGEGLVGAKIELGYLFGDNTYTATTGRGGRYTVVVPRATYYLEGGVRRWHVIPRRTVLARHASTANLRAVHPLHKVLKAELHFTRTTYAPGDRVHIVISLTDTGSRRLRGIGAECDHVGDPNEIANTTAKWGRLAATAPGVALRPHRTRTFRITSKVPAGAQRLGSVLLECDFGYAAIYAGYRPQASDSARVPGQSGRIVGKVAYYDHGRSGPMTGLAGVRLVLVDATRCPVLIRKAWTGAKGHFRFGRAPAGENYKIYTFAPKGWKVLFGNPTNAQIVGKETDDFGLEVARGSAKAPKVPTKCGT